MKDFMSLYSNLVERCFLSCCQDFTSKALSSKEVSPAQPWRWWPASRAGTLPNADMRGHRNRAS